MNSKNFDILHFSDALISHFKQLESDITNLKLQKLIYYCEAWYLVHFKESLFVENPQAWVNGPVYPSVYQKYSDNKSNPLQPISDKPFFEQLKNIGFSDDGMGLINSVLHVYGARNPMELVYKTHIEKPWIEARNGLPPFEPSTQELKKETMLEFYSKRVKAKESA